MKLYVIIPAHNEADYLGKTLQSLVDQTVRPTKIMVVNDNSTDTTQRIIDTFSEAYPFILSTKTKSLGSHSPGSKVVNAFNEGLKYLDEDYDIICKFDADLIFPLNYIGSIQNIFQSNENCGLAGGYCIIQKNEQWKLENLTGKDHIRGALKAYRKKCFKQIEGLRSTMGWDTVDELLAQYHGWKICTDTTLHVKHLKPTGASYSPSSKFKQGEAFYKMRYGWLLTHIASAKLAFKKRSFFFYIWCIMGYKKAKNKKLTFIVSEVEGTYIRNLRWQNIQKRFKF